MDERISYGPSFCPGASKDPSYQSRPQRTRQHVTQRTKSALRQLGCYILHVRLALLLALLMLPAEVMVGATAKKSHPYRKSWKHETVGKRAVGRVAAGAGVQTLRNKPSKYGKGAAGFGKRLGAGLATNAVNKTVEHGIAAKLHEDLHYQRSNKHGVIPRLGYALKSTVITRNTKTGEEDTARRRTRRRARRGRCVHTRRAGGGERRVHRRNRPRGRCGRQRRPGIHPSAQTPPPQEESICCTMTDGSS